MSKKAVKKITDFSQKPPVRKKEKEEPVSSQPTFLDILEVYVTDHWKAALGVLIALIVIIIGGIVIYHSVQEHTAAIRSELAAASEKDQLENLTAKYASDVAVIPALQKLTAIYLKDKEYGKAYDTLKKVADHPKANAFIKVRARLDCAGILNIQGNEKDAVQVYESVTNDLSATAAQKYEAAYNAAMISYLQKNYPDARRFVVMIPSKSQSAAETFWSEKAVELLKEIETAMAKVPEKK